MREEKEKVIFAGFFILLIVAGLLFYRAIDMPEEGLKEIVRRSAEVLQYGPYEKIDINAADAKFISKIPGIGAVLAERIITFREASGKFNKISDVEKVSGIGKKKAETLSKYVIFK